MNEPGISISDLEALAPALILFATGLAVLVGDLFLRRKSRHGAMDPFLHAFAASGAALAGVAILAGWDLEPSVHFGGALRLELFSRAFSGVIVLGAFLTLVSAAGYLERHGMDHGEFHALVLLGSGAMVILTQAGDLIMVFLSLETFSLSVYILTSFNRDEKRSVEGGLKYFVLGGLASGFLLMGMALVFGATGEIQFGPMAQRISSGGADRPILVVGAGLLLVGFGFKLGAFPFHTWIPDAYEGAPTLVTGFMAVAVKTAGFAALTRMFLVLFGSETDADIRDSLVWVLSALAIATCIFGNTVAIVQVSAKRMLAYSSIAHTGYLLIGLVAGMTMEQGSYFESRGAALVSYLLPYTLATLGALAIVAHLGRGKTDRESFDSFRGLARTRPLVALSMLIFMVSLAGIPPTAGFWAKLYLFREAVAAGRWGLALVGILTSIVAAYFYLRLVVVMYMQPGNSGDEPGPSAPSSGEASSWPLPAVIGLTALGTVLIGFFPNKLFEESEEAIRALFAGM